MNFASRPGSFKTALFACLALATALAARADQSASFTAGGTVRISVTADGDGPLTYQWKKNGANIAGATGATYTFVNAKTSDAGNYSVSVSNAAGSALSDVAAVTILPAPASDNSGGGNSGGSSGGGSSMPTITSQPDSQIVELGGSTTLSVVASGSTQVQWQFNGVDLAGATSSTLTLSNINVRMAGSYRAILTNSSGSVASSAALITVNDVVVPPSNPSDGNAPQSRLANVSMRTMPGSGSQSLIVGFVTAGAAKSILVRGIGPGLSQYISSPTFSDPSVELYKSGNNNTPLSTNDNWGGTTTLKSTFSRLGAFALADDSKDAAILATLSPSVYSVQVKGNANGMAIAEIYDADTASNPAGRIMNLSARTQVGTGDGVLVAGFVIAGNAPKRVLIRAIGPTLVGYGVGDALLDPKLELFVAGSTTPIQTNDNWNGSSALSAAFAATGAFALSDSGSKDAAMLVTLNPGAYSAVVSGVNGATGVALVELYDAD